LGTIPNKLVTQTKGPSDVLELVSASGPNSSHPRCYKKKRPLRRGGHLRIPGQRGGNGRTSVIGGAPEGVGGKKRYRKKALTKRQLRKKAGKGI